MWTPDQLSIPPGVIRPASLSDGNRQWVDANLVRWVDGMMRPVGGWTKWSQAAFASDIRAIHSWTDNDGTYWTAVFCEGHLYVISEDGTRYDVSPTPALVAPYDIVDAGGYGDDVYNYGDYGTARPNVTRVNAMGNLFTLGNWGQNLLAMSSSDGRLLQWDPSTPATAATVVTNAPINNRTFVVTDERHVMIFGADASPNRIYWCDQEDITDWTLASVTSKAGDYYVEPYSHIIGAKLTPYGIIFYTALAVYIMRFVGLPFVYSYERIGDRATPLTGMAVAQSGSDIIWLAEDGFWRFDGNSVSKVFSPVFDYIKQNSDEVLRRYRTFAFNLGTFDEIWFFYPSIGSDEADQYVCFSPSGRWWSKGTMTRTCGHPATYSAFPVMSDGVDLYYHEDGQIYGAGQELPYATFAYSPSFDADTTIQQLAITQGNVASSTFNVEVTQRLVPDFSNGTPTDIVTSGLTFNTRGLCDLRKTAPEFLIKLYQSADNLSPWSIGKMNIWTQRRGLRRRGYRLASG